MVALAGQLCQEWAPGQPGELGIDCLGSNFLPSLSHGSHLKLFSFIKAVHTLYVRCQDNLRNRILVNNSHTYFFSDFSSLPLYLRCELGIQGCLPSCSTKSKLVQFLRFNTTVFARDLVPCLQSALFIWAFLSAGIDRLPSVSSVPLSSWKHRSPSRTGETGSCAEHPLRFSLSLLFISENGKVFVNLGLQGRQSPNKAYEME